MYTDGPRSNLAKLHWLSYISLFMKIYIFFDNNDAHNLALSMKELQKKNKSFPKGLQRITCRKL